MSVVALYVEVGPPLARQIVRVTVCACLALGCVEPAHVTCPTRLAAEGVLLVGVGEFVGVFVGVNVRVLDGVELGVAVEHKVPCPSASALTMKLPGRPRESTVPSRSLLPRLLTLG